MSADSNYATEAFGHGKQTLRVALDLVLHLVRRIGWNRHMTYKLLNAEGREVEIDRVVDTSPPDSMDDG